MTYDGKIIIAFAERLYARANAIVVLHGLLGAVLGAVLGGVAVALMGAGPPTVGALVGGAVGCILGVRTGQEKAFTLKLQAQVALCQVQIECNTRRAS